MPAARFVPARLEAACLPNPASRAWLAGVPGLVREVARRWRITVGEAFDHDGVCSWVAPAVRADGTVAVLKIGLPHMEAEDEIAGLRFWGGDGMVRLLEADEAANAMLLERCLPGTALAAVSEEEQDVVLAGVLRRLWRGAPPDAFRPLASMVAAWCDEARARRALWQDAPLVEEGLAALEELALPGPHAVLLATDLHAGNVLAAERERWLAIDPKPFVGDRAYDATQHLLACRGRLRRDPGALIGRVAGLLGLDAARLRLWTFARLAVEDRPDWGDALDVARRVAP